MSYESLNYFVDIISYLYVFSFMKVQVSNLNCDVANKTLGADEVCLFIKKYLNAITLSYPSYNFPTCLENYTYCFTFLKDSNESNEAEKDHKTGYITKEATRSTLSVLPTSFSELAPVDM